MGWGGVGRGGVGWVNISLSPLCLEARARIRGWEGGGWEGGGRLRAGRIKNAGIHLEPAAMEWADAKKVMWAIGDMAWGTHTCHWGYEGHGSLRG